MSVYHLAQAVADNAPAWLSRRQRQNSYPIPSQLRGPPAAEATQISTTEAGAKALPNGPEAVAQNAFPDPLTEARQHCAPVSSASATGSGVFEKSNERNNIVADDRWFCRVLSDMQDEYLFSTILNLEFHSYSLPTLPSLIYDMQTDMATLSGWILPFLYGLLGSLVFSMRNMLDTRTPNIESFALVFRIALGGIAGIVIGWFWVPAPSKGAELVAINSAPFALAFLVGYSIDIFFSLLARLHRTISDEPRRGTSRMGG